MFGFALGFWTDYLARRATEAAIEMSEAVSPSTLAQLAVEMAVKEIGRGEIGGNNAGPHVRKYRGDAREAAWCASFVGWCFGRAAKRRMVDLPFKRSHGAKRIYKNIGKVGAFVDRPMVGDVVCWQRGRDDSWMGHVELVYEVDDDGEHFTTVGGNVGSYPARVALHDHRVGEDLLIGFARL